MPSSLATKTSFSLRRKGLVTLFLTEMWECFGRFGISSILVFYLINLFGFADAKSYAIVAAYLTLYNITPLIGGLLSDHFLGSEYAILFGGGLIAVGNFILVIPKDFTLYLGLALISLGNGFFLPSIAPLVGKLFDEAGEERDAGFTLYYLGRNIGALLAPILCGLVGQRYGYNYAFLLSGIGMLIGLVIFMRGRAILPHIESTYIKRAIYRVLILLASLVFIPMIQIVLSDHFSAILSLLIVIIAIGLIVCLGIFCKPKERRNLYKILFSLIFVIAFAAFLNQGGLTLNLFIERNINRQIMGYTLPPSVFYALDPAFMMLIGVVLAKFWARRAQQKGDYLFTTKFSIAFIIFGLGFWVFVLAAKQAQISGQASLFYVILAYFLFPAAELCIMPISLSLITKLSPKKMVTLLISVWMIANAMANYLSGVIAKTAKVAVSVHTLAGMKIAARIYGHLFTELTIACIGIAVVLAVISMIIALKSKYVLEQKV